MAFERCAVPQSVGISSAKLCQTFIASLVRLDELDYVRHIELRIRLAIRVMFYTTRCALALALSECQPNSIVCRYSSKNSVNNSGDE